VAPEAGIAYGWTRTRDAAGRVDERPSRRTGERLETLFPALLAGRLWVTATPLYRAAICAAAGGWSNLRLDEDWEFEARLGAMGTSLVQVAEPVAEHRTHAGEHAGTLDRREPARLADRAAAMRSIFASATAAGVPSSAPEMARFARSLFLLARRCGAAGRTVEARDLFALARRASTRERARGWDFRLVGLLSAAIGWHATGRLSVAFDARRGCVRGAAK
jgi:hypothetical protein